MELVQNKLINFYPFKGIENKSVIYILEVAGVSDIILVIFQDKSNDDIELPSARLAFSDPTQIKCWGVPKENKSSEFNPYCKNVNGTEYLDHLLKFDLQFLQHIDLSDIQYYLIQTISDLYFLPYFWKMKNFNAKVLCTPPIIQMGYHTINEFLYWGHQRNKHFKHSNYFEEQDAFQMIEEIYNVNYQEFTDLFQLEDFYLDRITKVNYGEQVAFQSMLLDESLSFEANSSGTGIGAAYWTVRIGDDLKLGIATNINLEGHMNACQPPLKIDQLDYLILGQQDSHGDVQRNYDQIANSCTQALQQGRNIIIPFLNHEIILDLQNLMQKIYNILNYQQ